MFYILYLHFQIINITTYETCEKAMIKKITLIIGTLCLLSVGACSQEEPKTSEKLRKVGAPIEGNWQIAEFEVCKPDQGTPVTITSNLISSQVGDTIVPVISEMKQLKSSHFIMLEGMFNNGNVKSERTFAYDDYGDKILFAGFIFNNELISRRKILEEHNSDGNAKENIEALDFNFCSPS